MYGGGGGGSARSFLRVDDLGERPTFSRAVLGRVGSYARPYVRHIAVMLLVVLASTGVGLVPPLIMRDLIDRALPQRDATRLTLLALAMVAVPLVNGLLGMAQRYLASAIGTVLVFWLGGQLVLQGDLTIGAIVAFGAYLGQMYGPISGLSNARVQLASALVSFERVFEVLDTCRSRSSRGS